MNLQNKMLKSNQGFTMQDLVVAILILMLFVGTIGSVYLAVYEVQIDTKLDSVATLFAVQIVEYIDKISYDEVENGMEEEVRQEFSIPNSFGIQIQVSNYEPEANSQDIIKEVKVTITYTFNENDRNITINRLKIKEA